MFGLVKTKGSLACSPLKKLNLPKPPSMALCRLARGTTIQLGTLSGPLGEGGNKSTPLSNPLSSARSALPGGWV